MADWQSDLDSLIAADRWYLLPDDIADAIYQAYIEAFSIGAISAISDVAVLHPYLEVGLDFTLTNPATLSRLEAQAAELVVRINDGTRYYLKRMLVSGVEQGLSSPDIADLIKQNVKLEEIIKQGDFMDGVIARIKADFPSLTTQRLDSIVNTEINRAETSGRVRQWGEMGLTKKMWATDQAPCDLCSTNEALGYVPMDYLYSTVFGDSVADGPPGHPGECHCHIKFDEAELMGKAGELKVWDGS